MINYFNILSVQENTADSDLKKAWKQRCREYHPDKVSHLGEELQQLAATKTMLVNEAYDTLKHPARKNQYLKQLALSNARSQHPQRRSNDAQPSSIQDYLLAPLKFLDTMRAITPLREIPSSLYFSADNLHFTLMPAKDGAWILFSRHTQVFAETQALCPHWKHTWNEDLVTGCSYLPGEDLVKRTAALAQFIQFFSPDKIELYLNPGERRSPVFEPNTVLISCLLDCSIPTAQDQWSKMGMNLLSPSNDFFMKEGWQERLDRILPQLFAPIRQRSPERLLEE